MAAVEFRLCDVLVDRLLPNHDKRVERERDIALRDLIETNSFMPVGHVGGPYCLKLCLASSRLILRITTNYGTHVATQELSLVPFRRLVRDYTRICESYYEAIRSPGPEKLEAIDIGRQTIHNKAAELVRYHLSSKVIVDTETARRLFTLIYTLIARNAGHRVLLS
ncbi:UPF0262 family protein [Sinorhizobium sp. 7-81]|uniref:UPF0262 family protein n=1 Tax=Sinorhizobium sp. 8-89 TaxID=3049089 RepID=UPI0024C2FAD7|nr:UPF0262 family protein [Sinorhizobium sp. 8-89]MDK1493730.1 UPF0262 family protein [Sinorhizobium sp. 8-89]